MTALSTVQAGSTVIGSATGDSLIVGVGDEDQFGIGASVIVWPSGQPLEGATLYDTMEVIDKTDNTLTVLRNEDHALDTIAEGDQVGLSFRSSPPSSNQTQVVTWGKAGGDGPIIDLGANSMGVIGLIKATISDVNLDGGTPGTFDFEVSALGSFDGVNWASTVTVASGIYSNPVGIIADFASATDSTPLYGHFFSPRFLRFHADWLSPSDLGDNASATVTLELTYY